MIEIVVAKLAAKKDEEAERTEVLLECTINLRMKEAVEIYFATRVVAVAVVTVIETSE